MQKNIVLVGFMGAGKTAVGKALAGRLNRHFSDLDDEIESSEKRLISAIFQESGEAAFREIEKKCVKYISKRKNLVIACGGGVVLDKENMENLQRNGIMIYLKASPEVIYERTKDYQHRPLLQVADAKKQITELLQVREPLYAQADFTVDTSEKTIIQVVEEILRILKR